MKKVTIAISIISIILVCLGIAAAYDPNYPIYGGRIRNVCGAFENDPNCYPNTCDVASGSCTAPSGYSISVYKCRGISKRPGTDIFECINLPGYNFISGDFGKTYASLATYAEPCTTIQIDVVKDGVGKDWIVWVSDRQSDADCRICPYQSTQARFQTETDGTLRQYLEVPLGTRVKAVGLHNQQAIYWPDTRLSITGPNNFVYTCNSQCWFTPPYVGTYTLHVTTEGYTGSNCEDRATLVVTSIPPTTTIPQYGTLKIFKFYDSNGNGIWESGEQPLSGFSFIVKGPVYRTVYTNADGYALLNDLPYGTYKIIENVPSGWSVTTANPQYATIDSPSIVEVRFGNIQVPPPTTTIPQYGTLKIFKFYDSNGNGIWESGEQPLSGFSFTVSGPITKTVYTNAQGFALLSDLPYGIYTITENVPSGWEVTTANPQYANINSPSLVEVKFGNRQKPTPPCTTTTRCDPCPVYEDITVGSLSISPYTICRERDASIEMSIPVKLVSGRDDTEITARFYVKNDDGRYILVGKDEHILDVGERKTFSIIYEYNAYDLSYGTHDVKVVVEGHDSETRYSTIRVVRCFEEKDLEVGFISLYPEYPRSADIVQGSVPITLKRAPSLPQNVYVEVRIDGKVLTESSLRFYHIETKEFKFYFNADKYGQGTHTIQVTAWIDGVSDTSMRRFVIDESSYYRATPEHCLIIKDFWTERALKEEEAGVIKIRVRNCGLQTEANIQSRLYVLNKTFSGRIIALRPNEEMDISFIVRIPEDTGGVINAKANVWNPYASDEVEKEFPVKIGYPKVIAEKEYRVRQCEQQNISFIVKNVGQVKDTFVISFEGEPAKWISAYPKTVELDAEESKRIFADVNVPCDAKGVYQFTIIAQGSPRYAVTSTLIVSNGYTGAFKNVRFSWLPILLLLALLLVLVLLGLLARKRGRNKPEKCLGPHGC